MKYELLKGRVFLI